MTNLKLSEIRERAERATPGPWCWLGCYLMQHCMSKYNPGNQETNPYATPCGYPIADDGSAGGEYSETIDTSGPDAYFIAHSRIDIPYLLAFIEEAREIISGVRGTFPTTEENERAEDWLKKAKL